MQNEKYKIQFSDGSSIIVSGETVVFPITMSEHEGEKFTSTPKPIQLGDESHHHHGLIPILTKVFCMNDFFTIDTEDYFETTVYKSSAVVSITILKNAQLKSFSF